MGTIFVLAYWSIIFTTCVFSGNHNKAAWCALVGIQLGGQLRCSMVSLVAEFFI